MIANWSGRKHGTSAMVWEALWSGEGRPVGGIRERSWNPGVRMFFASENDLTVTSRMRVTFRESGSGGLIVWVYSQ